MLQQLQQHAAGIVLTATGSPRTWPPADMRPHVTACPVEVIESMPDALTRAREWAGADGLVLVIGSLYLVGRAKTAVGAA
jgi:folylpolyglutamate synthase/dihydropteroate synthase